MFTGIVKEIGIVRRSGRSGNIFNLEVASPSLSKDAAIGDSVSVSGACLTVVKKAGSALSFNIVAETAARTTLPALSAGSSVNLEGALRAGEALGGHLVSGHVDCLGRIETITKTGREASIYITIPSGFGNLIVEKGSITVDGISLTIGEARDNAFSVNIIPHTLSSTTLGTKALGDKLNIEFDMIAKYIAKSLASRGLGRSNITENFLRAQGF